MLTSAQMDAFMRDGALIVRGAIDAKTVAEVRRAFAARVDDLIARAARLEAMSAPPASAGFDEKLTALLCAAPQYYQHLDISLPMIADLGAEMPEWRRLFEDKWRREAGFFAPDAVFNLITHPRTAAIARQILGDKIMLSPVQHVRIKPPQRLLPSAARKDANMARTLWHQDEAVVTEDAAGTPILTMWIAISDATTENGCMYAARGSHRRAFSADDFGLTRHCPGKELAGEIYIPDEAIDKTNLIPLEARSGDAVLLHRRTIHGAGANDSASLRWSFDLRYQPAGTPSGRDCFPSFALDGEDAAADGEAYRQKWRAARDDIVDGKIAAVFNTRWNKYASLCA
ncbi:MAG: phytanoyl-CoA dioxygenase family protein [Gammaproteobacteria bacterium]